MSATATARRKAERAAQTAPDPNLSGELSPEFRRIVGKVVSLVGRGARIAVQHGKVIVRGDELNAWVELDAPVTGTGSIELRQSAVPFFRGAHRVVIEGDVLVTDQTRWVTAKVKPTAPVTVEPFDIAFGSEDIGQLGRLLPAILGDDSRAPQLAEVWTKKVGRTTYGFGTDSYRMHRATLKTPIKGERTIPVVAIRLAKAFGASLLSVGPLEGDTVRFTTSGTVHLDGWQRCVPADPKKPTHPDAARLINNEPPDGVMIDRAALRSALTTAIPLAKSSFNWSEPTHFGVKDGNFRIGLEIREVCSFEQHIPAEVHGTPVDVAFNASYLRDCIDSLTGEKVRFSWIDQTKPAQLRGDDTFLALIMPVRVS